MGKIYRNVTELIGRTPIMEAVNYENKNEVLGRLFLKLEYFNPAGSVKDRAALFMINEAQERGEITKDTVIIEPTSGNTGIGLAAVAASRGYRLIIVMPDSMSIERRNILKAYGAELVLTDGKKGMSGAIKKAEELAKKIDNSFICGQFDNMSNPKSHFITTGPEIWEDMDGKIDIFVAGVGTGGSISGIGKYLKSKKADIKIVAVEPKGSPFLSEGKSGPHGLQGIGAGFIPKTLDTEIYDEVVTVSDEDALKTGKEFARSEGILIGISSSAALFAAKELAKQTENMDKNIVVLMSDSGERYLSTPMFTD